jgi:hypothetical protein
LTGDFRRSTVAGPKRAEQERPRNVSEKRPRAAWPQGAFMTVNTDYTPHDDYFGRPFIDVDEQRLHPRPHRYVHGGFEGTKTLFSFYFPEASLYTGRFAQFVEGGAGGNERSLTSDQANPKPTQWDYLYDMAFDDLNGYLVETNQGHPLFEAGAEPVPGLYTWRAGTECARFSRHLAKQIYGAAPKHGYIGGIGGGGGRGMFSLQNAPDVYDACTPQIIGSTVSSYSAMQRAILFLGPDKLKSVIDAVEPGGSGDPYAGLDGLQREALADLYRTGYPRGAENQLKHTRTIGFIYVALERQDPSYFEDFWTKPGYAGFDRIELLKPYIIETTAKVAKIVPISEAMEKATLEWYAVLPPDLPFAVELDLPGDRSRFYGCEMTVLTGEAKGRNLFINGSFNGLSGFPERSPDMMKGIKPGDEVRLDNRRFIAFLHHFLHSVRAPVLAGETSHEPIIRSGRPFAPDGVPMYPQRPVAGQAGDFKAEFDGKVIHVLSTHDIYVWPVTAGFYELFAARYGDAVHERFRFYWAEHGVIGPPQLAIGYNVGEGDLRVWDTRLINFQHSMGRYAWRYLREWVEEGKAPPATTGYHFTDANGLKLAETAQARGGLQPVVRATVGGGKSVKVKVGDTVRFEGTIDTPAGAGTIVSAEWDFDHTATFPLQHAEADGSAAHLSMTAEHVFDTPGTWFVCFRGGTHWNGKAGQGLPVHNLDRVRVEVS